MIYLDNAATSYKKPEVFYKAINYYQRYFSVNSGRGGHSLSIMGAEGIFDSAEELLELFGGENPENIAFSQNATMSLNQAIGGVLANGGHAVVTQNAHNSVMRPLFHYKNYTIVRADSLGRVSPLDIERAILPSTRLIISTHASNVSGTIEPIDEIGKIARKYNRLFLLDAAQTLGCKPIDVKKSHIDLLCFSAHKGLLGPLGLGGLYVGERAKLSPIIFGGTGSFSKDLAQPDKMPDLLQSGTINTPAIMALAESVKFIKKAGVKNISDNQKVLAYSLIQNLKNIDGVTLYGITNETEGDRNGTVLFNVDRIESGRLCEILSENFKIATRGGWHCAYGAHVALGSEKTGGLRASFGYFSDKKDVGALTDAVYKITKNKSLY